MKTFALIVMFDEERGALAAETKSDKFMPEELCAVLALASVSMEQIVQSVAKQDEGLHAAVCQAIKQMRETGLPDGSIVGFEVGRRRRIQP